MPQRPFTRDQRFLLPPSLDDLVPGDHPVRFVALWLDQLDDATWTALGIDRTPARKGEARYAPDCLLAIWLYGTMSGIRSTRDLERACREQLPFRWLSGNQTPDHNTLWRFHQRHRDQFRALFHASVDAAIGADLVDLAVWAVDGTKLRANAAGDRMVDATMLAKLHALADARLAVLEAQDEEDDDAPPSLPADLRTAWDLKARLAEGRAKTNTTDPDAHQMTARGVNRPSYNAQAIVAPVPGDGATPEGRIILGIDLRTRADDHGMLPELLAEATARLGARPETVLADAGYFSGEDLAVLAERHADLDVLLPVPRITREDDPYGPHRFTHDPATETLTCPAGQTLKRYRTPDADGAWRYAARDTVCRACPARTACVGDGKRGRVVVRGPHAEVVQAQRERMATDAAKDTFKRRKGLIEPVFGMIKRTQALEQVLLRGVAAVTAEWTLAATAHNLKTLCRARTGHYGPAVRLLLSPDITPAGAPQ